MTWGVHISLAPTWFDPAETAGIITPFMVLHALHDAMVKPSPKHPLGPSLAESWTASPDAKTYELVLRKGVKFHNGDPVTSEDVKFSFERFRGASARTLKDRVVAVETPDPQRVRFRLKDPWADFLLFYAGATGAGWIVPKKYVEKVGDAGFQKAPIGAGPYRFVSFTPGVELLMEAFEGYWRKEPNVKRLVFKVIPDEAPPSGPPSSRSTPRRSTGASSTAARRRSATRRRDWKPSSSPAAPTSTAATPDLDGFFREQAGELDRTKREAILHKMQQLIHEKVMYGPIWELGFLNGYEPRVEESGLGLIPGHGYSAPYEDVKLRAR